jgi:ferrous iron transport protein A
MNNVISPLSQFEPGCSAVILEFRGGMDFQKRVVSMGLNPGCCIEVLDKGGGGKMLIAVGDTRIALGAGMAEKIIVATN